MVLVSMFRFSEFGFLYYFIFVVLSHGEGRKKSVYSCAASLTVSTFALFKSDLVLLYSSNGAVSPTPLFPPMERGLNSTTGKFTCSVYAQ